MGIAVDGVVYVRLDAQALETVAELVGCMLAGIVSDDHRAHHEVAAHKLIAQAEHILVVGDAQVGAHLVLLDIIGTYHNQNLDAVAQLSQHAQLAVGLETRQHARCMMVVEELATQFKIEFSVELGYTLPDMF